MDTIDGKRRYHYTEQALQSEGINIMKIAEELP